MNFQIKIHLLVIFLLLPLNLFAAKVVSSAKNRIYSKKIEIIALASTWREESLLNRSDIITYKINTLNTVGRLGFLNYFSGRKYFMKFGLVLGQSENSSAEENFSYFQRSVLLIGAEGAIGIPIIQQKENELSIVIGGIVRSIQHSVINSNYKFTTKNRFLPSFSIEYSWKLNEVWSWRQAVGTQGRSGDTLWAAGFGYLW